MRVFEVQEPKGTFFADAVPEHGELDEVVISSNAYVLETSSKDYKEFCVFAQKYLTRVTQSYIGGSSAETTFFKRVKIGGKVYMKVPLFFPQLCNFTAKKWTDVRRTPIPLDTPFAVCRGFELYDYQEQVRDLILPQLQSAPYFSGILHAVCGAGKTGMTCYLMAQLQMRTVIFVNTDHLMNQWVDELGSWLGLDEVDDIGYISGKRKPPTKVYPVMICMLQSIRKGSKFEALIREHIQHYDLLVSDECHHMPANTYYETMSYFKGRHRLALSATLERSDDMIRLVPYLFGPVACRVVEDLVLSTYVKYLHPLHYSNPEHADKLYLPQWNPNAKRKINYGSMLSRLGDDLNRVRLTVQYNQQTFPGQRILYLSKLRCQAEYAAAYLQFSEHTAFCYFLLVQQLGLKLSKDTWWALLKMTHHIQDVEEGASARVKERKAKGKNGNKKKGVETKKKPKKPRKSDLDENTRVFLYMGGGAGSRKKRNYRDKMLVQATYLSCTAAIAGEAFNVRGVTILCILWPQKPNGLLEQLEGRIKRGKHVDRVDVVTVLDVDNDTFANTGRKQVSWFRKQRYMVHTPLKLNVDTKHCPKSNYTFDKRSIKEQNERDLAKRKAIEVGKQLALGYVGVAPIDEDHSDDDEDGPYKRKQSLFESLSLALTT
jgi:superfamily II DNA or RNA helicase